LFAIFLTVAPLLQKFSVEPHVALAAAELIRAVAPYLREPGAWQRQRGGGKEPEDLAAVDVARFGGCIARLGAAMAAESRGGREEGERSLLQAAAIDLLLRVPPSCVGPTAATALATAADA
ncbi:unnamed protein product, partial [Phaeothamnion confervicola]